MLLISETRGSLNEVCHDGAIAIATDTQTFSIGDIDFCVPLRSTAKPFFLGALLDGPMHKETFADPELAIMSSSHNGEPEHISVILELLRRYDISPELIRCGCHERWRSWSIPSPLGNNCSGKHVAFLIACKLGGYPLSSYRDIDGPIAAYLKQALSRVFGEKPATVGVDGCSIPTYSFHLAAIARVFRRYACDEIAPSFASVRHAHRRASFYVGGTDRLESYLLANCGVSAKSGSDGLWAVGVSKNRVGIAGKIWSGSEAAVQLAILHILDHQQVVDVRSDPYLRLYYSRPRYSLDGIQVGEITPCFNVPPTS